MDLEPFSHIVERIYDCALRPDLWPEAMKLMCEELGFVASAAVAVDFETNEQWHLAEWNTSPEYQKLLVEKFAADSARMFKAALSFHKSIDEPFTLSRAGFDMELYYRSPMYLEWAKPQHYGDAINAVVLHDKSRFGTIAVVQHERNGFVSDRQVEAMRLLIPHLRRAVTIGDFMNLKLVELQSFSSVLDQLAMGVAVVDPQSRCIRANRAASNMLRDGAPIMLTAGRLSCAFQPAALELARAVASAAAGETRLGSVAIPLSRGNDAPAIAYVLPLANESMRPQVFPGAAAAVFVVTAGDRHVDIAAVGKAYDLTPAEVRLLTHIVNGLSLDDASKELGVAPTTGRTHLYRVFSKTGVKRQSDLVRLALTMVPPLREEG
jgi:DNA-binding CsgD family transcriptional regulator/PAS domain-containing protein